MNYHMLFRGLERCGVATVEPKRGYRVPILLWAITEKCEKALDRYEGYPSLYRMENVSVEVIVWLLGEAVSPSGEAKAEATIYIMNYCHIVPPGQTYLNCIMDGNRAFGFHLRYLSEAVRRTERAL